jgi:hypothetical protein
MTHHNKTISKTKDTPKQVFVSHTPVLSEEKRGALRAISTIQLLIEYDTGKPFRGYVGLWTKADLVILFNKLSQERGDR